MAFRSPEQWLHRLLETLAKTSRLLIFTPCLFVHRPRKKATSTGNGSGRRKMAVEPSPPPAEKTGDKADEKTEVEAIQNGVVSPEKKQGPPVDVETRCGYGHCHPQCLQYCNNTKVALVVLSLFAIAQGFVVNGINNVNTTSYERRFGFSSLEVSMISSSYDLAAGIFVLPIGYYGRLGNKPRWLASACLVMAIGSVVMFLPHFTTGTYDAGSSSVRDLCSGTTTTVCTDDSLRGYLAVFIFGQFLHGIGGTTLYTIGIVWLDDNVRTYQSPTYVGIMEGCAGLGPAVGFIVGGQLLDMYVDVDVVNTASLTLSTIDPRWVGAWWIGFIISSLLAFCVSLLLFCFGWEMPEAEENRKYRTCEAHADGSESKTSEAGFGYKLKDMPKCTVLLLKNPAFMCLTFSGVAVMMVAGGFATFMPKFIQNQFNQEASWAALLTGFIAIPSAAGGQIVGGVIPTKMKMKAHGMIKMGAISLGVALLTSPVFLARCSVSKFAGISTQYGNSSLNHAGEANLTGTCNSGCSCTTYVQEPLCGIDGVEYFSGCHAGCGNSTFSGPTSKNFTHCSCISSNLAAGFDQTKTMATTGRCDTSCQLLPVFLAFLFVIIFCIFLPLTPIVTATLRVIPDNLRGYALALQWVFIRFFGSIPGPLLFGGVVDSSCVIWQDKCGSRGSCWIYDNFKSGWTLTVLSIVCLVVALAFMVAAMLSYKPPKEEEEGEKPKKGEVEMAGVDNKAFESDAGGKGGKKTTTTVPEVEVRDGKGKVNPAFNPEV